MHWTVQIIVVLLNIAWIVFFLPPDPFSVFVQRRYIDEDMLFGDFCIQLPPVNIKSDKNDTNTTSLESTESSLTLQDNQSVDKSQQDCQCNKTNIQQKDLYYSKMSDIELRPPAPGCEPKIIMKFPNMEVCLDIEIYISAIGPLAPDLNDTSTSSLVGQMTPDSPPVLELTSSEVTTNSGLISVSSSETATVSRHSKAPVQEDVNQDPKGAAHELYCCPTTIESPSVLEVTSSEVSTPSRLISVSHSEAAAVPVTHHPKATLQKKVKQAPKGAAHGSCCTQFYSGQIPFHKIRGFNDQQPKSLCSLNAIILITTHGKRICVDPKAEWIQTYLKRIEKKLRI